jgi:hypothetical protein
MKKFIALVALVLVSASTMMYAQESNAAARRAERKAQRDAERAKLRAEEEVQDMAAYQQAVQALKNKQFVLEANQVVFRNGMSAFVTSNTNFVLMNGLIGGVARGAADIGRIARIGGMMRSFGRIQQVVLGMAIRRIWCLPQHAGKVGGRNHILHLTQPRVQVG